MGQNGHDGQEAGSNGAVPAAHGDNGAAAAEDGAQGVQFREAGALERNLSLHPDDPPPEPFVYRNLEEIAEKLGACKVTPSGCPHASCCSLLLSSSS